jgi:Fe-S-cluster containining protein
MKDGCVRKTIKFVVRMRYGIDVAPTRKIKTARGEQFYNLAGSCKCCGMCCETPVIQVYRLLFYFESVRWALKTWHWLINGFEFVNEDRRGKCLISRCTHLDPVTHQCDSYDSRPGMCRDYPQNQLDFSNPQFIDGCVFQAVLKKSEKMTAPLESLDLPPETLQTLKQQLHLEP